MSDEIENGFLSLFWSLAALTGFYYACRVGKRRLSDKVRFLVMATGIFIAQIQKINPNIVSAAHPHYDLRITSLGIGLMLSGLIALLLSITSQDKKN